MEEALRPGSGRRWGTGSRRAARLRRPFAIALAAAAAIVPGAAAAATPDLNAVAGPVGLAGREFVDDRGRALQLRGFVLPYKRPPYFVTAAGFGSDDADMLAREGFNLMQLRFTYGGVEPRPGVYDEAYIADVVRTTKLLTGLGIRVLLQVNQGNYGPVTHGQGFPDWATFTDGAPNPALGFGPNFLANPALLRAWDNLWANRETERGEGIQEGFIKGVGKVLDGVADDPLVLGLDILNEPWLGSDYPGCFPVGREIEGTCPQFDREKLQPFYEKVIAALRPRFAGRIFFYEPTPTFDLGLPTYLTGVGGTDPLVAFTFHAYCSLDGAGADLPTAPQGAKEAQCPREEHRIFDNADEHSAAEQVPALSSEFGATAFAETTDRLMRDHEERRYSWTYAAYCCRLRTEQPSGDVILDPTKPPTPDNLDQAKLDVLVRPYPAALTGVATLQRFEPETGRFRLEYTTARAGGGSFPADLDSVVNVPRRHYPNGYDVKVTGARVVSVPGAVRLRLRTEPGAQRVELELTPAPKAPYRCASRRVVDVTLPSAVRGARSVTARATVDGRPARVRATRDARGRRVLRVRVDLRGRDRGRARVVATTTSRTRGGRLVRRTRATTLATCTPRRAR